jgi:prepilin-type N-terminal cleavage/methylation domain-containing protein
MRRAHPNPTAAPIPLIRMVRRTCGPRLGRGLTLIEIMVTMTCMAIAMVIVMPAFGDRSTERLRGAAQILVADLEFAQSESMSHGDDPRVLVIDADKAGYRIATKSAPATAVTNPAMAGPYLTRFGQGRANALDGVRVSTYSLGGDDQLGFGVLGQLDQAAPASITLTCGNRRLVVTVDPTTGEAGAGAVQ